MGTKAIDPQSIRNVTLIGSPGETTRLTHAIQRATGRIDHTIRIAELSSAAPTATLERSIRVADGVIILGNTTSQHAARLETILRTADDHQVARLCLITETADLTTDFTRCLHAIAETRGAVALPLQIPIGTGTEFEGVIDLLSMWALEPTVIEFYGRHWKVAEHHYRELIRTVMEQDPSASAAFRNLREIPLERLHRRIRRLTRMGDVVPVLCSPALDSDDVEPLLNAILRYLPSPLDVCQPEHALDY
ncbi:hypothetical protein ACIP5Y_09925 [Nocardia sp. NPDC088792]|uniref:hypothetical protein n=1 Tax=Nocardia sp. NPDC088792 TaxID=3364332 RepID=UPI0037F2D389